MLKHNSDDMSGGAKREFKYIARFRWILFWIAMATIVIVGEIGAAKTCQGFQSLRGGFNVQAQANRDAASRALTRSHFDTGKIKLEDLKAYRSDLVNAKEEQFAKLDCSIPFPHTH